MSADALAASTYKVNWAASKIAELSDKLWRFAEEVEYLYEFVGRVEHLNRYVFKLSCPPPVEASLLIGDVVHNLRSALDIMVCKIAHKRGKYNRWLAFPFAQNPERFRAAVRERKIKTVGEDLVRFLAGLQPYVEGNNYLNGLHELDIEDKHHGILPTYTVIRGDLNLDFLERDFGIRFNNASMPLRPGVSTVDIIEGSDPFSRMTINKDIPPIPVFAEGSPFEGQPVLITLGRLRHTVQKIIENSALQFFDR